MSNNTEPRLGNYLASIFAIHINTHLSQQILLLPESAKLVDLIHCKTIIACFDQQWETMEGPAINFISQQWDRSVFFRKV